MKSTLGSASAERERMPKWRPKKKMEPRIRKLSLSACREIVEECHYSHSLPSQVQFCYGAIAYEPRLETKACIIFSLVQGRWKDPNVWELSRLVRREGYDAPLTRLISKALGHIKKNSLTNLVVSFADTTQDHHGGIYQSCSWVYDGIRDARLDGFTIDGKFVPARTCNGRYGTSSETKLVKKLPHRTIEPHYDQGKHCYWKALTKDGMQRAIRLGLRSNPYPKPMLVSGHPQNYTTVPYLLKGKVQLKKPKGD